MTDMATTLMLPPTAKFVDFELRQRVAVQGAAQARDEPGDGEGLELDARHRDAEGASSVLVVAHGAEATAEPGAPNVTSQGEREGKDHDAEQVVADAGVKRLPDHRRSRREHTAAEHPRLLQEVRLGGDGEGERRDREQQAADPQRGQPEQDRDDRHRHAGVHEPEHVAVLRNCQCGRSPGRRPRRPRRPGRTGRATADRRGRSRCRARSLRRQWR